MIKTYITEKMSAPKRKRYKLSHFKGLNTTVAEENLPFRYSPKTYNFSFEKGVLAPGPGIEKGYVTVNGNRREIKKRNVTAKFLKFFRYTMHNLTDRLEKMVVYGDDGALYDITLNEEYSGFAYIGEYGEVYDAVSYRYDDRDGLLVSTSTGLFFLRDFTMESLSFGEVFSSLAVHNDRVFAVLALDEYKLYFSDDFNPSNWNVSLREGGYLDFGTDLGRIVKLVSFGGQLYIFFEHGIMRLSAYNDQTEFHLSRLYLSVGTISKGSVTICGDRMMFASTEGIFEFDGLSVKKVMKEVDGILSPDQTGAHAAFHGGKYYLACRLDMGSAIASGPNSLLIYDLWSQTFDVAHDLQLQAMVALDLDSVTGVLADANYPVDYLGLVKNVGKVDSTATYKLWESPVTALDATSGRKLLREIRVRCEGTATLKVELDGKSYTYPLTDGLNKVRVMRAFDRVRVVLSSDAAEIKIVEAELTVDHFGE